MLSHVLVQPGIVIVVLLFHEAFFDDDCEDVGDHTDGDENVAVEIELTQDRVNLNQVIVGIPNHISVHQGEKGVAADAEGLEPTALPEDGHTEEGVADEQRNHTYKSSADERSRLDEALKHRLVGLRFEEVPEHDPPGQHATKTQVRICCL